MIWANISGIKLGTVNHTITNLNILSYNQYPVQNRQSTARATVKHESSSSFEWMYYIGVVIGVVIWLLVLVNVFLDNCRSMFHCVELSQCLALMIYLQIWYHPALQNLLRGLTYLSLQVPIIYTSKQVWECDPKRLVYSDGCNLLGVLVTIGLSFAVFWIVIGVGKLSITNFRPNKHQICYNHIHNCYCVFGFMLGYCGLSLMKESLLYVSVVVLCVVGLLSLILGYQIIKDIYSGGYSNSTFFWALKKEKSSNQFSNTHPIMTMCRRICVVISIGLFPDRPLSAFSITMFCTIFILANTIWNQPFKIYCKLIPTIETLYTLILFLLQIYAINLK